MSTTCSKRTSRNGVAAVEFAVILPVLVMFFMAIASFGFALTSMNLMNNTTRVAARRAILDKASNAEIKALVKDHCARMMKVNAADVTIALKVNNSESKAIENAVFGDACSVAISIPFAKVCPFVPSWFEGFVLKSNCTMEHE